MNSLMQQALGADWGRLPPALKAHYLGGTAVDAGHLDIEFPRAMQPVLWTMSRFGALIHRRGRQVLTTVVKQQAGEHQRWQRTLRFGDGQVLRFDSVWVAGRAGHVIEFVNPVLGLEMQPFMVGSQLHYRGVRFVAKLGRWMLTIPEWLVLGHTTIVEEAVDERHFTMDFRMTHPLLGELFRYAGSFEADVRHAEPQAGETAVS